MCRMIACFHDAPISLDRDLLAQFVKNCHWGNWRVQDWLGHHGMGWGVAWMDPAGTIRTWRSLNPIWRDPWWALPRLKSRLIVVHARFALPWKVRRDDVHPITLDDRHFLAHNGTIKLASFAPLETPALERARRETTLDTRRYLAAVLDGMATGAAPLDAIAGVLRQVRPVPSANAFFFSRAQFTAVEYQTAPLFQRYTYVLAVKRLHPGTCVSSIPFDETFSRLPNGTALQFDFGSGTLHLARVPAPPGTSRGGRAKAS